MMPKDKDENAKDPAWKVPVDLPGVNPDDYRIDNESIAHASAPAGSALRNEDQSGTKGFGPQLSGHGKANHAHTSSFNAESPSGYPSAREASGGQEEGGRPRQAATSSVGRSADDDK